MKMDSSKARIRICCVCDHVIDDRQTGNRPTHDDLAQWMSLRSFLHLYRLGKEEYKLIDTYCPRCLDQLTKIGIGLGNREQQPRRGLVHKL